MYQRLEYIGDAVLDFLVTSYIFSVDDLSPGRMTDIRMHFVRNETLAKACVRNGLHKHLLHEVHSLAKVIGEYINTLDVEDGSCYSSSDEDDSVERMECDDNQESCQGYNHEFDDCSLDDVEVPKILGDLVESIIAAVYLDSDLSLESTWNVIKMLIPEIAMDRSFSQIEIDCVRELHEMCIPGIQLIAIPPEAKNEKYRVVVEVGKINISFFIQLLII